MARLSRRSARCAAVAAEGSGLAFRYRTSRHYYRLALEDGKRLRLAVRLPLDDEFRVSAWREIAVVPFGYDTKTWYRLEAAAQGDRLRGSIDGKQLIDVRDSELTAGIAGLTANMPARFKDFRVTTTAPAATDSASASTAASASWNGSVPTIRGRRSGASSTPGATAPAATSASVTSMATDSSTCCLRNRSQKCAATRSTRSAV